MDFKTMLSRRIGMEDSKEILRLITQSDSKKQELYNLVLGDDESIGYYAAWVLAHFSAQDNKWLYDKQDELIDEVLVCRHAGKRRVILCLLYKQPPANPPRVDFLDFCFEHMTLKQELPGVKSLCVKIAYELCRPIPELMQELKNMLEIMECDTVPSMRTVRKNVLKAMQKGKSLQSY